MRYSKKLSSILPFALLIAVFLSISWVGYYVFYQPSLESSQTIPAPELEGSLPSAQSPTSGTGEGDQISLLPDEQESAEPQPTEEDPIIIAEAVQQGDTAGKILLPYLTSAQIQALADVCEEIFPLRRLRVGNSYEITLVKGEFTRFVYTIDSEQKLIVEHEDGKFLSKLENIVYDITVKHVAGTINAHLFQAVSDAGEMPLLAISLADIFAWEINFIRDIHPGDSFNLLVEKRYLEGEFKGYGRILAAEFINQGSRFDAYSFHDAEGFPHYYNHKGESVKRAFLKAPLSFTRISSTFSPKRLHPILKVWRAHPGIDYAAPTGTPVKAVGSAVVTFKGWGKGAGNYIALRHNNGYETMYLHLSAFAKGLEKGKKVSQGEVIGFVGSTGYSTGPHLDFRMKKDGTYINPLTIASPRTEPVSATDMPEFQELVTTLRDKFLEGSFEAPLPAQASPKEQTDS